MEGQSKGTAPVIEVPNNSFTAFKLRFNEPSELYYSSTVISIGPIPRPWILNQKSTFVSSFNKLIGRDSISSTKRELKKTADKIKDKTNKTSNRTGNTTILSPSSVADTTSTNNIDGYDNKKSHRLKVFHRSKKQHKTNPLVSERSPATFLSILQNSSLEDDLLNEGDTEVQPLVDSDSEYVGDSASVRTNRLHIPEARPVSPVNSIHSSSLSTSTKNLNSATSKHSASIRDLFGPNSKRYPSEYVLNPSSSARKIPAIITPATLVSSVHNETPPETKQSAISSNLSYFTAKEFKTDGSRSAPLTVLATPSPASHSSTSVDRDTSSKSVLMSPLKSKQQQEGFENPQTPLHTKKAVAFQEGTNFNDKSSSPFSPPSKHRHHLHQHEELKKTEPVPTELANFNNTKNKHAQALTREAVERYEAFKQKTMVAKLKKLEFSEKRKLDKFLKGFQSGDIIMMEKMLVLVTSLKDDPNAVPGSSPYPRVIQKWREYIVVARSTGKLDYPVVLQFFSKRKIVYNDHDNYSSVSEDEQDDDDDDGDAEFDAMEAAGASNEKMKNYINSRSKDYEFKLYLMMNYTVVALNNTLDKSFSISKTYSKKKALKYVLLTQTMESSLRWMTFLLGVLQQKRYKERHLLHVSLPDLDISVTLKNVFNDLKPEDFTTGDTLTIDYLKTGYQLPQLRAFDKIIDKLLSEVESIPEFVLKIHPERAKFIRKLKYERFKLSFVCRQYDRLEWLLGEQEALIQTIWPIITLSHDLELREVAHESHQLVNGSMKEPFPIEGFLARLSNREGKKTTKLGRSYYKLNYFFNVDNLLLLQEFYHAVPPFEEHMKDVISPLGDVLDRSTLVQMSLNRSEVFEKSSFPVTKNSHVQWLNPKLSKEQFKDYDSEALYEIERRISLVANTHGLIDLIEVEDVYAVSIDKRHPLVKVAGGLTWGWDRENLDINSYFEISMRNGTKFRLQASSEAIRNEWIKRLIELKKYWTEKKREDMTRMMKLKDENMKANNISDDTYESSLAVEERHHKWEITKAKTDPLIYNISSYTINKPIIISGLLYRKRAKHRNFTQIFAVLTPGFLILYETIKRSKRTGVDKPTTYLKRYATVSLKNCYVYCFAMNDMDLIGKDTGFNQTLPGGYSLPRVYSDGWRSSEDQNSRYFSVWFGSKKVMLQNINEKKANVIDSDSSSSGSSDDDDSDSDSKPPFERDSSMKNDDHSNLTQNKVRKRELLKASTRLGVNGNKMIFLARSRIERDLWVTKLHTEIARFSSLNDEAVQLV